MTDSAHPEYVLGHAATELERLIRQAAFFGDLTEHSLKLAGLRPGMKVLDVGCGAGDVSFLAASLVGERGCVTGVDMNAETVALARSRASQAGARNVTFEAGDITKLAYDRTFDAVIGRLIVLYLGDHVAGMRAFRRYVKPGGVIYFQEFCLPGLSSVPNVPLFDECIRMINETFARAKIELYMGMHLARVFRAAGLPDPQMLGMSRIETGADSPAYVYMRETMRSLMPLAERTGVATREQVGIDTLADRLREQTVAAGAVLHLPELIAAWARVPD
jgi:ubiquinone/menaquinone biosynthesis C-methylase UbiE